MEPTIKDAPDLARKFVEVARAQGFPGVLDYSAQSIAVLDQIVGGFHDGGDPVDQMGGTILVASCYLGEVMRKTAGAEWIDGATADVPDEMRFSFMMTLGETTLVPYAKVAKRLENGPEDDLVFYYQVLLQQAGLTVDPIVRPDAAPAPKRGLLARLFGKGKA